MMYLLTALLTISLILTANAGRSIYYSVSGICPGKKPELASVGDSCGVPSFVNKKEFGDNANTTGRLTMWSYKGKTGIKMQVDNLPRPNLVLTAWLVWVPGGQTTPEIFEVANHASPCAPFNASFSSGLSREPNTLWYLSKTTAFLRTTLNFNPTYPGEGALTRETFYYQRNVPGIQKTDLRQYRTKDGVFIPTSSTYLRQYDRKTGFEVLDKNGRPKIVRSPVKAMGVEIIAHVDKTTHGISQGIGGVDHYFIIFFPFKRTIGSRSAK